jgi:hypothetical protein
MAKSINMIVEFREPTYEELCNTRSSVTGEPLINPFWDVIDAMATVLFIILLSLVIAGMTYSLMVN